MEGASEVIKNLFGLAETLYDGLAEVLPKLFSFVVWALCGIIILPSAYLASVVYPAWMDWGEGI